MRVWKIIYCFVVHTSISNNRFVVGLFVLFYWIWIAMLFGLCFGVECKCGDFGGTTSFGLEILASLCNKSEDMHQYYCKIECTLHPFLVSNLSPAF